MNYKRLCEIVIKDYAIPIYFIDEDQFNEVIETIDFTHKYRDAIDIARIWCEKHNKSSEQFQEEIHCVVNKVIDYIKLAENYNDIQDHAYDVSQITADYVITSDSKSVYFSKSLNIYKSENVYSDFISIDLVRANEQALIQSGVTGRTFKELISLQTDDNDIIEYISNSKHLRQVVYGNLNAKAQVVIEKHMTTNILNYLITVFDLEFNDIYGYTTDEIILNKTDNNFELWNNQIHNIQSEILHNSNVLVSVDDFILKALEPYNFYVKESVDKYPKFKCVPTKYYAQACKVWFNKPITENDLRFILENDVVRFEKPLW